MQTLVRWISRDPLGEHGGINLYQYAANNPISLVDHAGLCPGDWWDPSTWFNQGLGDSLGNTWASLQDSLGGAIATPFYGDAAWNQFLGSAAYGPLGQTENNPAAYASEWGLLGISGLSAGTAGYMIGGEVLASNGFFNLSTHVADQVGIDGERYWSETMARNLFSNGTRALNTGGNNGFIDTLTTITYEQPGGGTIIRNWTTNTVTHYLPY